MLLSYKPLHLEAQQRLQEEGCVVDIKLFSGTIAGEVYLYILQSNLLVSCFITSLVYKIKLQKNGIEFASYTSSY